MDFTYPPFMPICKVPVGVPIVHTRTQTRRLSNSDIFPTFMFYYRPYFWRFPNWWDGDISEVRMDRDRFVVILDVRHFSPDELTVKVNDDYIEVHAKRDEEGQDEHVAEVFYRKFKIPSGVDPGSITSSLSSDGFLTVSTSRRVLDITCDEKPPAQK
ncbi:hypothetical protein PO909_003300 [Leuciscus waleckii]